MTAKPNPLLQQAEDKIAGQLTPDVRANYMKIVVAGMHAALAGGPNSIMATMRQSKDPVADAAKGAVALVLILRREAHGIMPLKAMVPAGTVLMLKGLGFAEQTGLLKVGEPEIVRATHIFTDTLFAKFGITKEGIANAATRIHALTQDPRAVQAMSIKAGVIPHPGAPAAGAQAGAPAGVAVQ